MPVQITITGVNVAESLKELSILAAAIAGTERLETPKRQRKADKLEIAKDIAQELESVENPKLEEDTENINVNEVRVPTVLELRSAANKKANTADKKEAIRALLDEFGSKGVSDIPEENRLHFLARVEEL